MRKINYIVIHHSVTPRDLPLQQSVSSFSNSHKARLHPEPNSKGLHVAYHWVVAGDGSKMETRGLDEVGYHASSLSMNKESLGICLTGHFDNEKPSNAQMATLKKLVCWACEEFDVSPENVIGHKDVKGVKKTCPGANLYALLPEVRESVEMGAKISPWAEDAWSWGLDNEIIGEDSDPQKTVSKEELLTVLYRITKL